MWLVTVVLLTISNVFMTFAWYGHLRFKSAPLTVAILVSWLIACRNTAFKCRPTALGPTPAFAGPLKRYRS